MLYRGTQRPEIEGVRKGLSYTTSLPAAVIWSTMPPDVFAHDPKRRKAQVLPGSTVHIAELRTKKVLELAENNYTSFRDILLRLEYGDRNGIDEEEALKVLWYLHNRIIGRAKGGEFLYRVVDEDGELVDERDLPLSFTDPLTAVSEFREEFEFDPTLETAARLSADAFIFSDAPAAQKVARRLGYKVFLYHDVFAGGEGVSEQLFGIPVYELAGVDTEYDLEDDKVPTHETYRELVAGAVKPVETVRTRALLRDITEEELRHGEVAA